MTRLLSILLVLAVIAMLWASAATAADYIEDTTLKELNGMGQYREGLLTGVFLAIASSQAISCPMMSARMMIVGLDTALAAKEISGAWTVYRASLYVLARAGCKATTDHMKETPHA